MIVFSQSNSSAILEERCSSPGGYSEGWDEVTEVCWIFINCVELAVEEHMNTTSPVQERIRIRIRDKFFRDWERLYAMGH